MNRARAIRFSPPSPSSRVGRSPPCRQLLPPPRGRNHLPELQVRPRQPAQVLSHGRRLGAGRRLVTETRRLGLEQPPGPGRPACPPGKAPVRGGAWKQEGGGTGHPRVPGTQETPKPQRCPKSRTQGPQALGCGVEGPGPHCPQTLCLHAKAPDSSLYPLPAGAPRPPSLKTGS